MSDAKESKVIHPDDSDDVPKQPGRIISATEAKPATASNKNRKFQVNDKRNKLIIFGVGVLIIVAVLIAWPSPKPLPRQPQLVVKTICQPDTLKQAAALLISKKSNQAEKLIQLSTKIQSLPDYQSDPNCLFIIANAYLSISDYDSALSNLNKLAALDPGAEHLYVSSLYEGKVALDNLKAQVAALEKQIKNTKGGVVPSEQVKQ